MARSPLRLLSWRALAVAALAWSAAVPPTLDGCAVDAGSFSLTLAWEEAPTEPVWLWARVERRPVAGVPGPVLASVGPLKATPGRPLRLVLPPVPNGPLRRVVVEARGQPDPNLRVLYYGLSEPFSVEPGVRRGVSVFLHLQRPAADAGTVGGPAVELLFSGPDGLLRPAGFVRPEQSRVAVVRLRSRGAQAVLLANDASFSAGLRRVELGSTEAPCGATEAGPVEERVCAVSPWDLSEGLALPPGEGSHLLSVYARFVDAYGYESAVSSASTTLDTLGPALAGTPYLQRADLAERARVNDAQGQPLANAVALRSDSGALAAFATTEPLGQAPRIGLRCRAEVLPLPDALLSWVSDDTYFQAVVGAGARPEGLGDGVCLLFAEAVDRAGNVAELLVGELHYDDTPPAGLSPERQAAARLVRSPWASASAGGRTGADLRVCVAGAPAVASPAGDPPAPPAAADGCPSEGPSFPAGALLRVYAAQSVPDRQPASAAQAAQDGRDGRGGQNNKDGQDGLRVCTEQLLAQSVVGAAGVDSAASLTLPLAGDPGQVCLSETDPAGNESAPALVSLGTWIATLAGRVPADPHSNPHRLEQLPWFDGRLRRPGLTAEAGGEALGSPDGRAATVRGAGRWLRRRFERPRARSHHAMAHDPARGRLVLAGGGDNERDAIETWEWDAAGWRPTELADPEGDGSPPAREAHCVAYDPQRDRVVLFGGAGEDYYDRFWLWDGASWQALPLRSSAGKCELPPGLYGATLTHDPVRGRLLLYGGELFDAEEWDVLSSGRLWALEGDCLAAVAVADDRGDGSPGPRQEHAAAFDLSSGRLLVHGGHDYDEAFADTWAWDGHDWELLHPTDPEGDGDPLPRAEHTMAWDPVGERVVLHGGWTGSPDAQQDLADTWVWTGASWRRLPEAGDGDGQQPVARHAHTLAPHPASGGLLLFGGRGGQPLRGLADTWALHGDTWRRLLPSSPATPRPRSDATLTWDPDAADLLLLAGQDEDEALSDLWAFTGSYWTELLHDAPDWAPDGSPAARARHAACHDPASAGVLVFGGEPDEPSVFADLWLLRERVRQPLWRGEVADSGEPEGRVGAVMASHPELGHLLFGGGDEDGDYPEDTWSWSHGSWALAADDDGCVLTPPGRSGAGLQPDALGGGLLLYGGSYWFGSERWLDDLWRWAGECWIPVVPADPEGDGHPAARTQFGWAPDPQRGGLLLYGGSGDNDSSAGYQPADTWEWRGRSWVEHAPADPEGDGGPGPRVGPALAPDPRIGNVVLFGGTGTAPDGTSEDLADTWLWDAGARARPAHQLSVELAAARLPSAAKPQSLRLGWWGQAAGGEGPGASLLLWDQGAWRQVAASADDGEPAADAGAPLAWSTTDATLLRRLNRSPLPLSFALTPASASGQQRGMVSSDYVELRWDYELPAVP